MVMLAPAVDRDQFGNSPAHCLLAPQCVVATLHSFGIARDIARPERKRSCGTFIAQPRSMKWSGQPSAEDAG